MATLQRLLAAAAGQHKAAAARLLEPETYSGAFWVRVGLGLVLVLGWPQFVQLYQDAVVRPFLSQVVSYGWNDLAVALVAGLLGLLLVAQLRRAYRPGFLQLGLAAVPGLLYAAVRSGERWGYRWQFTVFHYWPRLYYADVLLLPVLGVAALLAVAGWRALRPAAPPARPGYLQEDAPTFVPEPARPDAHAAEAGRLMAQLTALRPGRAFAVGIVGPWGSGKTRFLHLMQQHLPAGAICVSFNPWLVESTAAIRQEFFTTLKQGLGAYSGELAAELGTYAASLAAVADSAATKAFREAVALWSGPPTLSEQFAKVNRVIGRLNRPIFVFLDDIDRLDKDEVLETLRIVRNTASFRRTVFVLAYDRAYVLEAVQRTNQASSGQYLDKIVQMEFALPGFSAAALAERALELLLPHVELTYQAALSDLISRQVRQPTEPDAEEQLLAAATEEEPPVGYYQELITTMRGAVRFANLFNHDFQPLAGEVRLDEFLNLTLLKLRFPALYDAVKSRRVVGYDWQSAFSLGGAVMTLNQEKLTDFLAAAAWPRHEEQLARQVVQHLFGKEELVSARRTIQRPSTFDIYFSAGNFTNVSLVVIEQLRRGEAAAIDRYLDRWAQAGQLPEAFMELTQLTEFNNQQDFENVVAAGLRAGRRLERTGEVTTWLRRLNAQRTGLAALYVGGEPALAAWLEQLLAEAPPPATLEASLVKTLRENYRNNADFQFLLSEEALRRLALHYLTQYLASHPVIDYPAFALHWASVRGTNPRNNQVVTDDAANTVLREAIQARPLAALPALLVDRRGPDGEENWLAFQPLLPQIFGSWEKVDDFIWHLPESPETTRIQWYFSQFKNHHYESFHPQPPDWEYEYES